MISVFRLVVLAVGWIALAGCSLLPAEPDGTTPLPQYSTLRAQVLGPLTNDERGFAARGCDWRLSAKWGQSAMSGYGECVSNEARIAREELAENAKRKAEFEREQADIALAVAAGKAGHVAVPPGAQEDVLNSCWLKEQDYKKARSNVFLGAYNQCVDHAVARYTAERAKDAEKLARSRESQVEIRKCYRSQGRPSPMCALFEKVANDTDDLRAETGPYPPRCVYRMQRYGPSFVRTCLEEEASAARRIETQSRLQPRALRRCQKMLKTTTLAMVADCVDNGSGDDPALDESLGLTAESERLRLLERTTAKHEGERAAPGRKNP